MENQNHEDNNHVIEEEDDNGNEVSDFFANIHNMDAKELAAFLSDASWHDYFTSIDDLDQLLELQQEFNRVSQALKEQMTIKRNDLPEKA